MKSRSRLDQIEDYEFAVNKYVNPKMSIRNNSSLTYQNYPIIF